MSEFHIESKEIDDQSLLISISGEGNYNSARKLNETLETIVNRSDRRVIVDVSALDYLASLFLGYLVQFQGKLSKRHCPVVLLGVCPKIRETLDLANLSSRFIICETMEEALQQG